MTAETTTTTSHVRTRLDIATGRDFTDFRAAFEAAVPEFDLPRHLELLASGAAWSDVERLAERSAPYDFLLYATLDPTPMMAAAGHDRPAVEYLMGNHVLAERMFRHHPDALLYAPLRVLLRADEEGLAVLVVEQPSTVFAGLGSAAVDEVARLLDEKLAALLRALDATLPAPLLP